MDIPHNRRGVLQYAPTSLKRPLSVSPIIHVRVYPLDATAKQQVRVYGSTTPYAVPDYLIL